VAGPASSSTGRLGDESWLRVSPVGLGGAPCGADDGASRLGRGIWRRRTASRQVSTASRRPPRVRKRPHATEPSPMQTGSSRARPSSRTLPANRTFGPDATVPRRIQSLPGRWRKPGHTTPASLATPRPSATVRWDSNPHSSHASGRGRGREGAATCGFSAPVVPARARRRPAVPPAVGTQRGPGESLRVLVDTTGIRDMTSSISLDSGTTVIPAAGPGTTCSRGCGR
jgi:hypothetical protein